MPVAACPSTDTLKRLLAEHLPVTEREEVAVHLEHCCACQSQLDVLLADESTASWSKLGQARSNPRVDPNFLSAMRDLVPALLQSSSRVAAVESASAPPLPEGPCPDNIAGYEILGEIGRGGMSVVYKARQPRLGRIVALKRLRVREENDSDFARFRREAEAIAVVPHPNIVQVFEFGDDNGRPFLALEYVPGGSLAEALHGAPVEPRTAAGFLLKIAGAIHHAHQQGVIHRDLKPANVLLTTFSSAGLSACEPKVADFGLARRVDEDRGLTQPDMLAGTPAYVAPEQIGRQSDALSPTCDIYALGVLLYEMLTGRPPLLGPTVLATLRLVEGTEPVTPRKLQPNIPKDLETICLKCLRKDPARRYATAEALAEDLRRFQDNRPIRARRAGTIETAWRWSRRNPALAALAAALLISLGIGAALSVAFVKEARHNEAIARDLAVQSTINSRLANDRAYTSDLRLASAMWSNRQLDLLVNLLEGQRPKRADDLDRRGFEWHYLWRASHPPHRILKRFNGTPWGLAFGEDSQSVAVAGSEIGLSQLNLEKDEAVSPWKSSAKNLMRMARSAKTGRVAVVAEDGTITVLDSKAGSTTLTPRTPAMGLDFSPPGDVLAAACRDGRVRVWTVVDGRAVRSLGGSEAGFNAVAFSPDGRRLAAGGRDGVVRVWNVNDWSELPALTGHVGEVTSLAFHRENDLVASGSADHSIRLWQISTGRVQQLITHHLEPVTAVAFSPDGHWLASGSTDRTLRVVEVATSLPMPPLLGHTGSITAIEFTPDGESLCSASVDKTVRLWDFTNNAADRRLTGHVKPVHAAVADPLGRFFATASSDGEIRLWDSTALTSETPLKGPKEGINGLTVNPDSTLLAAAGTDRRVHLWDLKTRQPLRQLSGHLDRVECVAFSSDGTRLASGGADQWVRIWNPATGELINSLENARRVACVAWHPSKAIVAAGAIDGSVTIYDIASGLAVQRLNAHKGTTHSLAFSPDGLRLATAGSDRVIQLWDVESWSKRESLLGHLQDVTAVQFGPDNRRLFSAGRDGTVRVWNAADGHPLLALSEPTPMNALAISSNGLTLLAAGKSGLVRVWKAIPDNQ